MSATSWLIAAGPHMTRGRPEQSGPRDGGDHAITANISRPAIARAAKGVRWGTPTGRAAKRGAESRCLTWEVSSGWYESILTEGPLSVTPARLTDPPTSTASSDLKEDPRVTASPVPRPPHNTGRDPHPDTHISGEVDRVQRSIGYLITTARINVASRQLGAPFRRRGASSSRR